MSENADDDNDDENYLRECVFNNDGIITCCYKQVSRRPSREPISLPATTPHDES